MLRRTLFRLIFAATTVLLGLTARAQDYVIPPQFDYAGHFHDGLAPVFQDGRWGFVDVAGRWVVRPQFEKVISGADRRFGVMKGGKWGYLDSAGTLVIPHRYNEAGLFSEGFAVVSRNGDVFTRIDTHGREQQPETGFEAIYTSHDGLAIVKMSDTEWSGLRPGAEWPVRSAFLTRDEHVLGRGTRVDIEELTSFREQVGFAKVDGRYTPIWFVEYENFHFLAPNMSRDISGIPSFAAVRWFSDGLAAVSPDGKRWGFVDKTGAYVIAPQFDAAREFSEGVAPVQLGGKWGYVDRSGKIVFAPRYDRAYSFAEGFATVREGDLRGFLQMRGAGQIDVLYAPQFEDVYRFQEGLAPVKTGGTWGFIAAPGAKIVALRPIQREEPVRKLTP